MFAEAGGVFVAATDYMKKIPAGIARWVPGPYEVLGTDGYGLSESRAALRRHFEVDTPAIVQAALGLSFRQGDIDGQVYEQLVEQNTE